MSFAPLFRRSPHDDSGSAALPARPEATVVGDLLTTMHRLEQSRNALTSFPEGINPKLILPFSIARQATELSPKTREMVFENNIKSWRDLSESESKLPDPQQSFSCLDVSNSFSTGRNQTITLVMTPEGLRIAERLDQLSIVQRTKMACKQELQVCTRPITEADLTILQLSSEERLIELLEEANANRETKLHTQPQGKEKYIVEIPLGIGRDEGFSYEKTENGFKIGFEVPHIQPISDQTLTTFKGATVTANITASSQITKQLLERDLVDKSRATTLYAVLPMLLAEVQTNIIWHNILGISGAGAGSNDALRKSIADMKDGHSFAGSLSIEIHKDNIAIVATQPNPFEEFQEWINTAEDARQEENLEVPTGRGALIVKNYCSERSISQDKRTMTFKVPFKEPISES